MRLAPFRVYSEDEIGQIHEALVDILETVVYGTRQQVWSMGVTNERFKDYWDVGYDRAGSVVR